VFVREHGSHGGAHLAGGKLSLRRFLISRGAGYGIWARGGQLELRNGVVSFISSKGGEGIAIRAGRAVLEDIQVKQVSGSCVQAAERASVEIASAVLDGCGQVGISADGRARVTGKSVRIHRAAAAGLAATAFGHIELSGVELLENDEAAWADCDSGASVELSSVTGKLPLATACIRID
jgi:hypothetical protein